MNDPLPQIKANQTPPDWEPWEISPQQAPRVFYNKPRRKMLPLVLFLLTCLSTFWVGVCLWTPNLIEPWWHIVKHGTLLHMRELLLANWQSGLIYMICVLTILLLHEFGHFFATLYYRVPASFPYFLPFPFNPLGTLGAVIGMQGNAADRKQIFDIGIAGPLAGLVAAVPIGFYGVSQLDLTGHDYGGLGFRLPLLLDWFAKYTQVPGYQTGDIVYLNHLNPWFVAGWVGMLVTGLNMMPVGQLDGGHVTYTMFGKAAHVIAQLAIVAAIAYMVYHLNFMLGLMVILVLLMGPKHPPTLDDSVPLGVFRYALGLASLSIPFLCFPPRVFEIFAN